MSLFSTRAHRHLVFLVITTTTAYENKHTKNVMLLIRFLLLPSTIPDYQIDKNKLRYIYLADIGTSTKILIQDRYVIFFHSQARLVSPFAVNAPLFLYIRVPWMPDNTSVYDDGNDARTLPYY